MQRHIRMKRLELKHRWILHHDNARPHTAKIVEVWLTNKQIVIMQHFLTVLIWSRTISGSQQITLGSSVQFRQQSGECSPHFPEWHSRIRIPEDLLFGAPHFPNSAFAETGPRLQCAARFPHWEFSSVLALCRLQGAGPDLLPMVVLAGSWVCCLQIIQYYNHLIRERFIHITRVYIASPLRRPKQHCIVGGLVLASGFFVVFYSGAFSCATSHIPEPR